MNKSQVIEILKSIFPDRAIHYLEMARTNLEELTGKPISKPNWLCGFRSSS
jgi:hypothetical protein